MVLRLPTILIIESISNLTIAQAGLKTTYYKAETMIK